MKRLTALRTSAALLKTLGCVCLAIFCFANAARLVQAQTAEFTQNAPGSHDMTLDVALGAYPGRGVSLPVTLRYSTRDLWRLGFNSSVSFGSVSRSVAEAIYAEHSTAGWTTSLDVPHVEWPRQNDVYWYTGKSYAKGTTPPFTYRVAQLFMHLPDGSSHEMRKTDAVYADNGSIDMVGTFYAVDSSRMRYDSTGQNTGILYLPNGSRYIIGTSTVQYIDVNGNTVNFDVNTRQWTDTLGRVLSLPWPANPGPGDFSYSLPGINGSSKAYTIKFRSLSDALTAGGGLRVSADYYLPHPDQPPTGSGGANFPQPNSNGGLFLSAFSDPDETSQSFTYVVGRGQQAFAMFNPTVLTEIVLPTGQSYKFSYNAYGELDKVIYPTGGYQRYDYAAVAAIGLFNDPYTEGSRGVVTRTLSVNGTGTDEAQWTYSTGVSPMTVTAPDGTRTEVYLYYQPVNFDDQFGYKDAREGLVSEQRVYAPQSQGGAMLRRTINQFGVTTSITNKPVPPNTNNSGTYTAYRNPRLEKTINIILDTGGNALVKTTVHGYIDNGNQFSTGLDENSTNDYHFASLDQTTAQTGDISLMPLGALNSRAEMTYVTNSAYTSRNILGLPTSVLIKDANLQIVSRVDSFYDEAAYPLLTYSDLTGSDYIDPGTSVRGNVTTARFYSDTGVGLFLDSHTQFDQCGNVRSTWNERNIQAQLDYSAVYKHAFATLLTTPVPDTSGAHGSATALTSSSTFDYTTGLRLTSTDANGQVTSYSYQDDQSNNDPLNRLRKTTRPDGSWTKYSFGDTVGNLFTLVETKQDATRTVKTYQYLDPMGRASRTFITDDGTNYIARDTIYDQLGREWKTSNPYRTATLNGVADVGNTNNWLVRAYDSLDRNISLTMPDGAVVQTSYQGVYTTVSDEAGRQRRQKVDAFGRVVRVDEPDSSGNLGAVDTPTQATYYDYNAQGNLVHITQGSGAQTQHRYFKYDSLGRLTYERQVEQAATFTLADPLTGNSSWSRKLVYDETINSVPYPGLLTSTYDARNVQTQFRYDNLNRVYQVTYSDGTPTVTNNYDQARGSYVNKGRLTESLTAAVGAVPATGQLYDYDLMGRVINHQQTVGSQTYSTTYGYSLGGALTSETYPSGRVVNYAYDNAARLSQVSSGATVYTSQYDYTSPTGQLKSVNLGNGAVESYAYNSRMQIQSLDLTKSGTQIQHYDYKYGVYNPATNSVDESKNTGKIAQIEGFIGGQKQWQQRFAYDTLGRLSSAREFRGDNSAQSYLINYDYDVFGNRYQKQSQNAGNPFTQNWVEAGDFNQTTNRFNSGVTYDSAGNITVDSRFRNLQYQYDANNRQKQSANLDGTGAVVSVFDAVGQRVGTQVGGVLVNILVYDAPGRLLAEYNSAVVTGGTQYLFDDHQNSPRVTTGASGAVVARHDYLPFGEDLVSVGLRATTPGYAVADTARQKYAGMERNETTNMAHTLWRQYDSFSARWTSPDPYGGSMEPVNPQSFNRYTYVNNDPVNLVDQLGLMWNLPDASTSWSDVAGGFWGWGDLADSPRSSGRTIIAARMAAQARLIQARIDGKLLSQYLRKGQYDAAKRLLNSNSDIGVYQNGKALWGTLGAAFIEGYIGATQEAFIAASQGTIQATEIALRILMSRGFQKVIDKLKYLRRPDFFLVNVNIVAGVTRFVARGDSMENALQGVSAGDGATISFADGWILQLEAPTHDEIVAWGSGLSFSVDVFVLGGGGMIKNPVPGSPDGVYIGVGVGIGVGASFNYKVPR